MQSRHVATMGSWGLGDGAQPAWQPWPGEPHGSGDHGSTLLRVALMLKVADSVGRGGVLRLRCHGERFDGRGAVIRVSSAAPGVTHRAHPTSHRPMSLIIWFSCSSHLVREASPRTTMGRPRVWNELTTRSKFSSALDGVIRECRPGALCYPSAIPAETCLNLLARFSP
jgi:hypothetical protein